MAKTVKQLAQTSKTTTETILKQLADAGLPSRGENDLVTDSEQDKLVAFLKQSHGEKPKSRISLKSKTTSTAQVTGTSGKAKTVNVVRTKKVVYDKPDPAKIEEKIAAQAKAAEEARLKAAEEKQAAERSKKEAAERQAATLAAMRASSEPVKNHEVNATVVVKKIKNPEDAKPADKAEKTDKKKPAKPIKKESATDKKAREAREAEEER